MSNQPDRPSLKPTIPLEFQFAFESAINRINAGKHEEAEPFFEKAAKICPEVWLAFGCEDMKDGNYRGALQKLEAVNRYAKNPKTKAAALNNIGTLLSNTGLGADSIPYFEQSWGLLKHCDTAANLGLMNKYAGNMEAALKWINRAIQMNPKNPLFYFNRSLMLLTVGDYENGLRDYVTRFKNEGTGLNKIKVYRTEWEGQPLAGKTLLVYGEQGAGDTIQMLRFGPQLKAMGARLILAPQKGLDAIAGTMGCWDEIIDVPSRIEHRNIPHWDYQIPAMELMRVLKVTPANLRPFPYIQKPAPFTFSGRKPVVGIVWGGSLDHKRDRWRSTNLDQWSELLKVPATFVSLQVGQRTMDLVGSDIPDIGSSLKTYSDTAAALAGLDLLISVDTSAVHLAGAMGLPVWMLCAFCPDWRWGLNGDYSPWYPTVRIFRQDKENEWGPVFERVALALKKTFAL